MGSHAFPSCSSTLPYPLGGMPLPSRHSHLPRLIGSGLLAAAVPSGQGFAKHVDQEGERGLFL
jgi:hypothetical protein